MVATDDYTSTLPEDEISSLSDQQEKILSILPIISGLLSLVGSLTIMHLVIINPKKTPYRRILLAMSICDIVATIGMMFQGFLIPSDTSQWIWSIGNDATCTALGFLAQFGFAAQWYSGMLSVYFCWTVRLGKSQENFTRSYLEPTYHIFILLWSLTTATTGAILGAYNPYDIGQGCWIKGWPEGCGSEEGEVPCKSPMLAWIFGGLPSLLNLILILVNNLLIYCHVRHTVRKGIRNSSLIALHNNSRKNDGQRPRTTSRASTTSTFLESQCQRVRAVGTQSFLYVAAYLITYLWGYILRIMESIGYDAEDQDALFPLLILQSLLLPSQGFFNMLIFLRPQYIRCRSEFPNESYCWCIRRAMYGDKIQPNNNYMTRRRNNKESTTSTAASVADNFHSNIRNGLGKEQCHDLQQQQQDSSSTTIKAETSTRNSVQKPRIITAIEKDIWRENDGRTNEGEGSDIIISKKEDLPQGNFMNNNDELKEDER